MIRNILLPLIYLEMLQSVSFIFEKTLCAEGLNGCSFIVQLVPLEYLFVMILFVHQGYFLLYSSIDYAVYKR